MIRARETALLIALLALAPAFPARAFDVEECRALLAAFRATALQRWRGPRANANRYPLHCENEYFLAHVREAAAMNTPLPSQMSIEAPAPAPSTQPTSPPPAPARLLAGP